ncbi:MAG: type IV secretory system conjugative DNA transfer family protein [Acetatifactor sp.]|nr:type IV secretory system conjugative DNA transfer family protein [Acetatifactor sp.]
MEPKKKDVLDYLIPIIGVIVLVFCMLHLAMSYEKVKTEMLNTHTAEESLDYIAVINDFATHISENPGEIKWVDSSFKFLAAGLFICLLVIAYQMSSRKKFINNKEYGTSEWGTPKQIAHLLASRLKKNEIKAIKKSKDTDKAKRIADAKKKYADSSNILFTQTEKICMYNFELNNNTMIIGGSGSGKTRGYVLPNILQCCNSPYSPSIVVTDPKGEIIAKVGQYLEQEGYVIKVLNLKEQNRSFGFNPFKYIMPDKYEEQISNLVSSIMDSRNEGKESKSNDPFWDDMAKVLLKAIFYACYEGFPEEERNMPTIMELFRWFEVSDNDDRYNNPTKLDRFFDVFGDGAGTYQVAACIDAFYQRYYASYLSKIGEESKLPLFPKDIRERIAIPLGSSNSRVIEEYEKEITLITSMLKAKDLLDEETKNLSQTAINNIRTYIHDRESGYADGGKPVGVSIYEKYGDVNANPALRNWEDFRTKCKGKTAQSVTATALAKLAPFDEEQIRRIFSKDEMDLDLIGERRTALFIVLPPTNKTYNFIANVLYTMLFEQLEYCATVKHNQSLPVPVRFICDEFYNTGRIPNFENILSYARSFGIGISIILQSLDQIKEMYEKSWGTVLDNCSTFLYLGGIRHADTLEYISKLLGKGTFDKKTYSQTKGRQSSSSTSFDKIGRELLDPAEIQRLNKKKCLFFVSGYQPYLSRKFNYKGHPNYKYTSDANKKNLYFYQTPQEKTDEQQPIAAELPEKEYIQVQLKEKVEPISLNLNANEVLAELEKNILSMDFDSSEAVSLSDDEMEELEFIAAVLEEENRIKEAIKLDEFIPSPLITLETDEAKIEELIKDMVEDIEDVDFVSEEWEEDTMINEEFLNDLGNVDMEMLESGVENERNEEK